VPKEGSGACQSVTQAAGIERLALARMLSQAAGG